MGESVIHGSPEEYESCDRHPLLRLPGFSSYDGDKNQNPLPQNSPSRAPFASMKFHLSIQLNYYTFDHIHEKEGGLGRSFRFE